ncbi:MAG TPA: ATP cone domain-containing protein [archaeon]|nr:ATP cone domain-containing protein [archaeon]
MKVIKRNGRTEDFSKKKMLRSIGAVLHHVGVNNHAVDNKILKDVIKSAGRTETIHSKQLRKYAGEALARNNYRQAREFYDMGWVHSKPVDIKYVIKKNGKPEKFMPEKIFRSVHKSFRKSFRENRNAEFVVREIIHEISNKDSMLMHTSDIRHLTERAMLDRGLKKAAKHYAMHKYT